jgi:nicotinamide mononucleotide adenylyltransferase
MSPVHDSYGKKELVSATHRCEMLRLALQNSSWVRLSDWECHQEGWTRTRLVLQYHQVNSVITLFALTLCELVHIVTNLQGSIS